MVHSFYKYLSFKQVTSCSMHSIVTTFRGAVIKVEVANFCAAMDTLIDQDGLLWVMGFLTMLLVVVAADEATLIASQKHFMKRKCLYMWD